jgi:hypothetical protein
MKDRASYWRERDPEENDQGRLPAGERIEVPAIWVTELYTPSTVAGLFEGIKKLDWEHGLTRADDLAKWMSDVRHGRTAGWTSLGLVSSKTTPGLFQERTAELPLPVEASMPIVMSITPSVTALVIAFLLDDSGAAALESPLRRDYTTFVRRDPRFRWRDIPPYVLWNRRLHLTTSYHTPDFQRRDAAAIVLDDLEAQCVTWVQRHLPGVFASGLRAGLHPTAMLFVSDGVPPLTEQARQIRALEGTGLDRGYDCWQTGEWPNCRMALPHAWRKEELRLRFGCRRADAFPEEPGYPEPQSNWTIAHRADDLVRGLLSRWALSCMLDGYHQLLSSERDRSARSSTYRSIRDLRQVRRLLRRDIYDARTSAVEVKELTIAKRSFTYDVLEMEYVQPVGSKTIHLLDEMRTGQASQARQVARDSDLLLSTLASSAHLTQAVSNIRVQRITLLLSVISIVTAIAAIVVAVNAGTP